MKWVIIIFASKLKTLRKNHNLSQEKLANILQVSKQSVYKWENEMNKPDSENLKRIADYFMISIDELLNDQNLNIERKDEIILLTKDEKDNLKTYINYMPIIGLITSILAAILFILILDYEINSALIIYVLMPFIIFTFAFYIPYKIINKKRNNR